MRKQLYEYPVPFIEQLHKLYPETPWMFSDELIETVQELFKNPVANKRWFRHFNKHMDKWDARAMLKAAWRVWAYYKDHPQQYGGSVENCVDSMTTYMYRAYFNLHDKAKKTLEPDKWYSAQTKVMMPYVLQRVVPLLADEKNWVWHKDAGKRPKRRKRKGTLRKMGFKDVNDYLAYKVESGEWE